MNKTLLSNENQNHRNNNNSKGNGEQQQEVDTTSFERNVTDDIYQAYAGDYGHSKYWRSLQIVKPIRFPKRKVPAPIDNAGLFSFITFSWLSKVLSTKKAIELADIPALSKYDSAKFATERLTRLYEEDSKKHDGKPSIKRTVFRYIRTRIIVSSIAICLVSTCSFVGPAILVNRLISYPDLVSPTISYGIALVLGLVCTEVIRSLAFTSFWAVNYRTGIRTRAAVLSMMFQKVIRLRSLKDKSVGELVNLLANDGQRLLEAIIFGGLLFGIPLQFIASAIYLFVLLGWTAVIGLLAFLAFSPLQLGIAKAVSGLRQKSVTATDTRVRMMNEILTCVKLIKMYAWEDSFADVVDNLRETERSVLAKSGLLQGLLVSIVPVIPAVSAAILFLVHTLLGYPLSAAEAFTTLAVFNSLRFIMGIVPLALKSVAEVFVSFRRMDSLLLMEEVDEYYTSTTNEDIAVEFNNISSAWDVVEKSEKKTTDENLSTNNNTSSEELTQQVLFDIDLTIRKGRLIGICGSVGSGKSSLISTILGQLRIEQGSLGLNGSIAYVPQQAWIFHDTVRENILFGSSYNEEKYDRVVEACSLGADFEVLPDKDQTEVGERGINLSGGQKQRVSLARAVYSDRDIILLDDPLSAVDAHVGKHIFSECIKKSLAGKTIIFVTHQLQYLKDCDEVLLLKNGRIADHGSHDELLKGDGDYSQLINNYTIEQEKEKKKDTSEVVDTKLVKKIILQRTLSNLSNRSLSAISDHHMDQISLCSDNYESFKNGDTHVSFYKSSSNTTTAGNEDNKFLPAANGTAFEEKDAKDEIDGDALLEKNPVVLIKSESTETGSVKSATYLSYIRSAGGWIIVVLVMFFFLLVILGISALNWWLTLWIQSGGEPISCPIENSTFVSNETFQESINKSDPIIFTSPISNTSGLNSEETVTTTSPENQTCIQKNSPNITTNPMLSFFQTYYFVILILTFIVTVCKAAMFANTTLKASSGLHNKVFRSVFGSPMSFFDTTPTGRILNRFSTDLDLTDTRLPFVMDLFLQQVFFFVSAFVTMIIVFPWFAIPLAVLITIFFFIYVFFRSAVRQLKRLDNTSRSPWFSLVGSSVQGLSTIHAYDKSEETIKAFGHLLDQNSAPNYAFLCSSRWLGFRMDLLAASISSMIALFVVFSTLYPEVLGEVSSSFAGLALSYSIAMTGILQVAVRFSLETESLFTSVERINEYILDCPSETSQNKKITPLPKGWPGHGEIEYSEASMRYRPDLPLVLKKVDVTIKPKQKIGIVGRTGSGKSSLGTVLFRLVNLEHGKIIIDGMNINNISLKDLRKKLSIIPQDPVLFVGTVRYNLDPFKQYSDDEIWKALERSHIKETISQLPDKLESEVVENGENFSVGERQLLCMARAILRHSRIIMLDEATAAIDSETDKLVQDTIREAFADCTMLTIAHRLNTVLTCDKILVMDDGEVAEFDEPAELLRNTNSHFSKMIQSASNAVDLEKITEDE